jgi:hypothetical protein
MKTLSLIFSLLAIGSGVNAATWSTSFSGSLTNGGSKYHYMTFPGAGTLNATYSITYSGSTGFSCVGLLQRSGATVATLPKSDIAVWPNETYAIYMFCPYGSGGYSGNAVLTYVLNNNPPVISSLTASPSPAMLGDSVTVTLTATDPDGDLANGQFEYGGVRSVDNAAPYTHTYTGLGIGSYTVTAYAVDAAGNSTVGTLLFTISKRTISVKARTGTSRYGSAPTDQGVQLVSGTLASGDTLQSIGLSVNPVITATTPKGTYSVKVLGNPANYIVSRENGLWYVTSSLNITTSDTDGDGLPNWLEQALSTAGFSVASIKSSTSPVGCGEISPPSASTLFLYPGQPSE